MQDEVQVGRFNRWGEVEKPRKGEQVCEGKIRRCEGS